MKSHLNTEKLDTGKLKAMLDKPIVLTGMMGTGKSHAGKLLAEALDIPFFDSDSVIEENGGITIAEIFELYGEEKFRESETRTILDLLNNRACVIATGGGALTTPAVLDGIKEKSLSVWLKTDVAVLLKRLEQDKKRPLLQENDPESVLKALLEKREPLYAQMGIVVETHGSDIRETVADIIRRLEDALTQHTDSM